MIAYSSLLVLNILIKKFKLQGLTGTDIYFWIKSAFFLIM